MISQCSQFDVAQQFDNVARSSFIAGSHQVKQCLFSSYNCGSKVFSCHVANIHISNSARSHCNGRCVVNGRLLFCFIIQHDLQGTRLGRESRDVDGQLSLFIDIAVSFRHTIFFDICRQHIGIFSRIGNVEGTTRRSSLSFSHNFGSIQTYFCHELAIGIHQCDVGQVCQI